MIEFTRLNPRKLPRRYGAYDDGEEVAQIWQTDEGYEGFVIGSDCEGEETQEWFKTNTRGQAFAYVRENLPI